LLQRFYDANGDGLIQIDGVDIKNIHLKTLRETIGYVSQEPILMIGTIRENLLFGNRDATEQDCIEALY
jgi:ABC-type multidrug transport system fused ATPase/permease subunit